MVNHKKVLLFHVDNQKTEQIRALCSRLKIQAVTIDQRQYGESLGFLAGIQGIPRQGSSCPAAGINQEMMVFSGIPSEELDSFLKNYREDGIAPIPLKAILTPSNLFWSAGALYGELLKEHSCFSSFRK